jgi:pimeloyl-ACP methyl ester carboxylesterase
MSDSPGTWTTIDLAGHPCDVYEPSGATRSGSDARSVILYLHGVHSTPIANSPAFNGQFAELGMPVLSPQTGRSWWNDRINAAFDPRQSAERYVLDRVLPFIAERWQARPPQIALLGTSMGGQGALRLAFRHAGKFPIVAAISPAIDFQIRWREGDETLRSMYDDEETARQDTATLHVHPLNWPRNIWFCCDPADYRWFDSADRLRMKLLALGIPHECDLTTTGGGHGWRYYDRLAPAAISFIAERLDRESRRVI